MKSSNALLVLLGVLAAGSVLAALRDFDGLRTSPPAAIATGVVVSEDRYVLTPLRSAFGSAAFEFGRQSAGGGSNGSTTPGLVHLSSGSMPAPVHAKAADLAPSGDLPAPPTLALALLAFAGAARGTRARGRNARLRPTVHALVLTLTLAVLAAPAPAQPVHAPVTKAAFGATAADVEAFLNWAERSYPQYFPGPQPSRTLEPYVYRQYAASGNYLGVADGSVYVLGPLVASPSTPVRVGRVADYECEVHPARCKPRRVAGSLLIDVASDLRTRAAMESFLGGPLLATWNPTDAGGPGIKIMMFGAVPGCPEGERGPMGTFADAQLAAAGYRGAATAVDAAMRFEAKPHAGCGFAASGRHGPSLVFADGAELWLATSTLDGPEDLLRPFAPGGQNGLGNNARVLNTSVNYRLAHPFAPLQVFASNGVARVSTVLQLARLQAGTGSGGLTQAKQQIALILSNQRCGATHPGRLCMIHYLFALGIAQSGVSDWSAVDWAQGAAIWADPVMSNMPVVDVALVPPAGTTGVQRETRLPLYTSRGAATQHAPFEPLLFAVDITFEQLGNALRVASARLLGEAVAMDEGCAQCERIFGAAWNDPTAWVVHEVLSMQEIYDETGRSGAVTGGYAWLYAGPAP